METPLRALSSIGMLLLLIFGVILFKRIGLLEEENGRLCSALITKVTLPALILVSLIHADLQWNQGKLAFLMMTVSVVCLGLGWLIARSFRIDGPGTAAVVLTTGFGSSSLLGFTLIAEIFPGHDDAMVEAVIISGLGVQPLLFTVGTMIAQYYGVAERTLQAGRKAALAYFRSPIFIALVSGIVLANLTDQEDPVINSILDGLRVVSAGNTLMVLLSVGLLLQLHDLRRIVGLAVCVGLVNLVVMPLLLMPPVHAMNLAHWQVQVLVLEGSMPAAMLSVVLCDAYGADARLAAKLVLATTAASVFTIPAVFLICGLWWGAQLG